MNKVRLFFSKHTEKFILFSTGVLVSAVVSSLAERAILASSVLLIISLILLVLATVFYLAESTHSIQELANKMEIQVQFVEELYREHERIKFKGTVYDEATRLVRQAKQEILILSGSIGREYIVRDHPARAKFLAAIEEQVTVNHKHKFKYARIFQIPDSESGHSLRDILGARNTEHCHTIIDLEHKHAPNNPQLSLSVMRAPVRRLGGLVVVDKEYVALTVPGMSEEGKKYPAGLLILQDRGGTIADHFRRYFNRLEQLAQGLTIEDLSDV